MIRSERAGGHDRRAMGRSPMASMMSRVKSRGCEVVKRTRRMPGISPTAARSSAKDFFPSDVMVGVHILAEELDFGVPAVGHTPCFGQD